MRRTLADKIRDIAWDLLETADEYEKSIRKSICRPAIILVFSRARKPTGDKSENDAKIITIQTDNDSD